MGDRKAFTDSIIPLPEEAGVTKNGLIVNQAKPEHRNDRMALLFSLDMPSQADLEQRVAKGEVISADELNKKYAPKAADVDALKKWLTEQQGDGTKH
jgi:kumamolisin